MSESKEGLRGRLDSPTDNAFNASSPDSGNAKWNTLQVGSPANPSKSPITSPRPLTIDPLSHHILKRTNTEGTIPQKLKIRNAGVSESTTDGGNKTPTSPEIGAPSRQHTPEVTRSDTNLLLPKKKGVSFLSRFSIIGGKKKDTEQNDDDETEFGDDRVEGMNATTPFSSSIGANGGYIPEFKEPPRYIKVRTHKKVREFSKLFLSQELNDGPESKIPPSSTRQSSEIRPQSPNKISKPAPGTNSAVWACVFSISGDYLAVAGQSQVITLWKVLSTIEERQTHEREEASANRAGGERLSAPVFAHKPAKEFRGHTGPILDLSFSKNNFLLSSSMDKTVRLWHISREECLLTFTHKDLISSVCFHPTDDRFFLAGSLDSILRLWSIPDKAVAYWVQLSDMITAVSFSPDGKTAIAGTLNGICFFYTTEELKYQTQISVRSSRGKNSKGSKITGIKTATLNGDPEAVKVLITSNDSRIRLYNLRDKALELKFKGHENVSSQLRASFSDDQAKHVICGSEDGKTYIWNTTPATGDTKDKMPFEYFEASDIVTVAIMAPARTRRALDNSGDELYDLCHPKKVVLLSREESNAPVVQQTAEQNQIDKQEQTPAYLERSAHRDGQIIITADYSGSIKVFRQDCAHQQRDQWDNALSKKILGRTNSIRTRTSNSSRRSSISSPYIGGSANHILSWRNAIPPKSMRERSSSPNKFAIPNRASMSSMTIGQTNIPQTSRQPAYASTPLTTASSITTTSPPPSLHQSIESKSNEPKPGQLPTPSFTFTADRDNALKIDNSGRSYQFWNRSFSSSTAPKDALRPPIGGRELSQVSKLSSDASQTEEEESDGEALSCKKCGGKNFKARKTAGKALLVCTKCFATN